MAQTYEVGLRYTGSDAASRALRDADAIDAAMSKVRATTWRHCFV